MLNRRSLGINIFGIAIIVGGSLWFLLPYARFPYYQSVFNYLPGSVILARYALSLSRRCLEIVLGLGLLRRKNIFRKISLGFFTIMLLATCWVHPYRLVAMKVESNRKIASILSQDPDKRITVQGFINIVYAVIVIPHMGFAAIFLYYFTRPKVREQFH